jgi:hypothetical protein
MYYKVNASHVTVTIFRTFTSSEFNHDRWSRPYKTQLLTLWDIVWKCKQNRKFEKVRKSDFFDTTNNIEEKLQWQTIILGAIRKTSTMPVNQILDIISYIYANMKEWTYGSAISMKHFKDALGAVDTVGFNIKEKQNYKTLVTELKKIVVPPMTWPDPQLNDPSSTIQISGFDTFNFKALPKMGQSRHYNPN